MQDNDSNFDAYAHKVINVQNLIIGAGISGLIVGRSLQDGHKDYVILEKSNGLGGRLATRRIEGLGLDHGAPYLKHQGLVLEFLNGLNINSFQINDKGIYVEGGMTKIAKSLGENLNIRKNTRVEKIKRDSGKWILKTNTNEIFSAENVILTAPIPQAIELLESNHIEFNFSDQLKRITYAKAILALIVTESGAEVKKLTPSEIHSVISMKNRELHQSGFVVRASEDLSEKLFELPDAELLPVMTRLSLESFLNTPAIRHIELKKWRYVTPHQSIPYNYLQIAAGLYLIGDGFFYPDIRGSISSAKSLVAKLL